MNLIPTTADFLGEWDIPLAEMPDDVVRIIIEDLPQELCRYVVELGLLIGMSPSCGVYEALFNRAFMGRILLVFEEDIAELCSIMKMCPGKVFSPCVDMRLSFFSTTTLNKFVEMNEKYLPLMNNLEWLIYDGYDSLSYFCQKKQFLALRLSLLTLDFQVSAPASIVRNAFESLPTLFNLRILTIRYFRIEQSADDPKIGVPVIPSSVEDLTYNTNHSALDLLLAVNLKLLKLKWTSGILDLRGLKKLKTLSISGNGMVFQKVRFPVQLENLTIACYSAIPENLNILKLRDLKLLCFSSLQHQSLHDLSALNSLEELNLENASCNFTHYPHSLLRMNVYSGRDFFEEQREIKFPPKLESLTLLDFDLTSLQKINFPDTLRILHISCNIRSLNGLILPQSLRKFQLVSDSRFAFDNFKLPDTIELVDFYHADLLDFIPPPKLRYFRIKNSFNFKAKLPNTLQALHIEDCYDAKDLHFPDSIKTLRLSNTRLENLGSLPNGLITLDISRNDGFSFEGLVFPHALRVLRVCASQLAKEGESAASRTRYKLPKISLKELIQIAPASLQVVDFTLYQDAHERKRKLHTCVSEEREVFVVETWGNAHSILEPMLMDIDW